jgi:hypothetical protein
MSKPPLKPLPDSIQARAKDKARRFPSPAGDRVNVWEVVLRHRVSPTTVYQRTANAGLQAVEMSYPVGPGRDGGSKARKTATWLESDIEALFAPGYGTPADPYGTKAEVYRLYGIAPGTLKRLAREGLVGTIRVRNKDRGRGGRTKVAYNLADCKRYERPPGRRFCGMRFDGIHEAEKDGRKTKAYNLRAAADRSGIPLTTLAAWANRGKKVCPYLPEGYLPTAWRVPPPPYGGPAERTVLEADLARLQRALQAARWQPSHLNPEDGLRTAKEMAAHYGLTKRWEYAKLGVLLAKLSGSGQLARKRTRRFHKGGRCYRPYGYDRDAFDRLLAGRELRDILAELVPFFATGGGVVRDRGCLTFAPAGDAGSLTPFSGGGSDRLQPSGGAVPGQHKRPAKAKHLRWLAWHEQGMGYGRIAMHHFDLTGEEVTKDAVAKALTRLKEG